MIRGGFIGDLDVSFGVDEGKALLLVAATSFLVGTVLGVWVCDCCGVTVFTVDPERGYACVSDEGEGVAELALEGGSDPKVEGAEGLGGPGAFRDCDCPGGAK